ncbi:MAG TPA: epoxyqueuosine reductase, partial [Phycisphaerae bacterium]|nr:epoxyqueuosine reductase [Phycisphaerae bacterium]
MSLKNAVKQFAYQIGADLVGIGNIERCEHAPAMMSPQGLMPSARSIIVMAVHHPDACVEMGGETHPQEVGPYAVQYLMNTRLDEMSYRMATFLEKSGCQAVPIAASNIWRYTAYKQLDAVFAPDVSHIYMAVVAGLADMGFHGMAMTPEFGARNRFITVITDVDMDPDPLIEPGTICDNCMLCREHCPAEALSKEIDGENVLRIEDKEYRFANKNLWRCSWGEHFDLDLDLPKPEQVNEQVILDVASTHGTRGGEMGQCLKYCVPKNLRTWDREYSSTPMRRPAVTLDESVESRALVDSLLTELHSHGIEHVISADASLAKSLGLDLESQLPGAKSIVLAAIEIPEATGLGDHEDVMQFATSYTCDSAMYDLARSLEDLGFRSITCGGNQAIREFIDKLLANSGLDGKNCQTAWVIT